MLRNAMLPVVTTIGLQTGLLLSGAVLTETVFAFAGIGQAIADAIVNRDYPVLQGFILIIAVMYVLVNLLVDISYGAHRPEGEGAMTTVGRKVDAGRAARRRCRAVERERRAAGSEAFRRLRRNPVAIVGARPGAGLRAGRDLRAAARPARPHDADLLLGEVATGLHPRAPAPALPLGVDHLGRDELSRLIVGARQTLLVGVVSTSSGSSSGMTLGVPGRRRSAAGWTTCSCGSSTCCCRSRACCWRSPSR